MSHYDCLHNIYYYLHIVNRFYCRQRAIDTCYNRNIVYLYKKITKHGLTSFLINYYNLFV